MWLAAAALTLPLGGCDLDAAVFVEATIESGSVAVTPSGLVTGLDGALSLQLHLGGRASGDSDVSFRSLSLTTADRTQTLVDNVAATPTPTFPLVVAVDSDVSVNFSIVAADNQLASDASTALCGSGDLAFVVVLDDGLRGGTISTASDPIAVAGCP